jgi:hypothetical protein
MKISVTDQHVVKALPQGAIQFMTLTLRRLRRSIHGEVLKGTLPKPEEANHPGIYSSDNHHLLAGL